MHLAWLALHPKLCAKISDRTVTTELLNSWGTRASHLRSSCFSGLARNAKNRLYCRQVVSVSTVFYDGSLLNRKDCEANIRGDSFVGGEVEFDRLIARMGYSRDQLNEVMVNRGVYPHIRDIPDAESSVSFGSPGLDYWMDVVRTPEFQAGLDRLPNF